MTIGTRRVLWLTGALALVATALTAGVLWHLPAVAPRTHISWYVLACGFAAAEIFVIHLDVRLDTYSISLMELPFVIGLFLASPLALIGGRLLGAGLALAFHRRQAILKLAFNLSLFAAETAIGIIVFRGLAGRLTNVGPASWAAAFAAAIVTNVVSTAAVTLVIRLNARSASRLREVLVGALMPPVANTSLALGAAALLWNQPEAAWLLGAIAVILVLGYRAYAAQSQRYANLQRLYEFTDSIQQATRREDLIATLLAAARQMLRAETAELTVIDLLADPAVMLHRSTRDEDPTQELVSVEHMSVLWSRAVETGSSLLARRSDRSPSIRSGLDSAGLKDCVIVPMHADGRIVGTVTVADREGDVSTFDDNDVRFFEAVVNHVTVALENAQLVGRLQHDALHDALTGLPNRNMFNQQVETAIDERPPGRKVAVILMDLDRFKEVNDTLGHHHGDLLLREVGARLEEALSSDFTIARLGGDEFALVCRDLCDEQDAVVAARAVRDLLDAPFMLDELMVDVGATLGIALCPDDGEDPATLLQRADVAMYSAKHGTGIELYASDRDQYSPRRLALVGELRQALERGELDVHYQPKADIGSGRVVGVEALLRWQHPEHGFIPPTEFIPVAEHTGLIRPLTLYVLRRAIAQCRHWQEHGVELHTAVNISVRNLVDLDVVSDIRTILAENGVRGDLLTLEITETSIMDDPERTVGILEDLSAIGVQLSVDDFGTGYSSLTYLKRLPVNEVKIDKSFVATMGIDPSDAAIVRSIIDLARNLGLSVVAEGVETVEAWEQLADMGCPVAQGYYLSRPLPADRLTAWLAARSENAGSREVTSLTARRVGAGR